MLYMNSHDVSWEISELPHCCGVLEVGVFEEYQRAQYVDNPGLIDDIITKSYAEAWKDALEGMRNDGRSHCGDFPLIFNFVKRRDSRQFSEADLRTLVISQPDCLFVHKWINPNSGNLIEQYMLTNGSTHRRSKK